MQTSDIIDCEELHRYLRYIDRGRVDEEPQPAPQLELAEALWDLAD